MKTAFSRATRTLATGVLAWVAGSTPCMAQATIVNAPDTVYMALDTMGTAPAEVHWDVLNETDSPLTLMVTRTFVDTVSPFNYPWVASAAGSYERFCWGPTCFQYGQDSSPTNAAFLVTLEPGQSTDTFRGDFYPNGVVGSSTLTYCFHPEGPASLGACHTVTYTALATASVPTVTLPATTMTLHPNPASNNVTLSMDHARGGKVQVRNLVGQVVQEFAVPTGHVQRRMALDGLSDGVWLVTYAVEESVLLTQRLIVN